MQHIMRIFIWLLASGVCMAADPTGDLLAAKPESVEAWKDMRFGMFICWGPVTLTGEEIGWSRGNPTPVEEIRQSLQGMESRQVRCQGVGQGRQGNRLQVHRLPAEASRRLLPLGHEADRLQHHERPVQAGCDQGDCSCLPRGWDRFLPVLLDMRLASPGLPGHQSRAAR